MDARVKPAHDELWGEVMFRPFPIIAEAPYSGDAKASGQTVAKTHTRSGQAFAQGPGAADARQGVAAGAGADRAGAGEAAQSRHRPGNRGTGLADRVAAAGG